MNIQKYYDSIRMEEKMASTEVYFMAISSYRTNIVMGVRYKECIFIDITFYVGPMRLFHILVEFNIKSIVISNISRVGPSLHQCELIFMIV